MRCVVWIVDTQRSLAGWIVLESNINDAWVRHDVATLGGFEQLV
jgi:hypothetical protein